MGFQKHCKTGAHRVSLSEYFRIAGRFVENDMFLRMFLFLQSKGLVISIFVFIVNPHGRERYEGVPTQSYQNCLVLLIELSMLPERFSICRPVLLWVHTLHQRFRPRKGQRSPRKAANTFSC